MKIFNILNGAFYVLWGLYGAFLPGRIAEFMGWDAALLGLHEIRAVWMGTAAVGVIILMAALTNRDQKLLTLMIVFATLALAAGRCLGLLLDGTGPMLTYYELGFELVWSAVGAFLVSRAKPVEQNL